MTPVSVVPSPKSQEYWNGPGPVIEETSKVTDWPGLFGAVFAWRLMKERALPLVWAGALTGAVIAAHRLAFEAVVYVILNYDPGVTLETSAPVVWFHAFVALAPYGAAAVQVLDTLGQGEPTEAQLVMGENVGQAFTLVATGNAELGLVALSQVRGSERGRQGAYLALDPDWYDPIRQDAVLLLHGADNAAARAFLDWLRGQVARELIAAHGYGSR